jgi:hypothetical protein
MPAHQSAATTKRRGLAARDHDGFRVIARKDVTRIRLYSRPGDDLTWR